MRTEAVTKRAISSEGALCRTRLKSGRFYKTQLNTLYFPSNTLMMITSKRMKCVEKSAYIMGNNK